MSLMMFKNVVALACFAYASHARRVHTATDRSQGSQHAERGRSNPRRSLATLLRAQNPVAAFSPSAAGASRNSRSNRASRSAMNEELVAPKVSLPDVELKRPKRRLWQGKYLLPQIGDIVRYPSQWKGEWEVGQVDFVLYDVDRDNFDVDIITMKSIQEDLYVRVPIQEAFMEKLPLEKIRPIAYQSVSELNAYRVNPKQIQKTQERLFNSTYYAESLDDYESLKEGLVNSMVFTGIGGALFCLLTGKGIDATLGYFVGTLAGVAWMLLLQRKVDTIEKSTAVQDALLNVRFLMPVIAMSAMVLKHVALDGQEFSNHILGRDEFLATFFGILTFKVPTYVNNLGSAIYNFIFGANEKTQYLASKSFWAMSASMIWKGAMSEKEKRTAAEVRELREKIDKLQMQKRRAAEGDSAPAPAPGKLIVVSGPSEAARRTLISKLLAESPDKYGFTISCTTRPQRGGEVDGSDYTFLSGQQFDQMVLDDKFIECSTIGGAKYGTSLAAVEAVCNNGKSCLIDLDVKNVEELKRFSGLRTFSVYVAPPSLDALRAQLGEFKKDSSALERAMEQISKVASSADCFDKIVLKDDLDESYSELKQAIEGFELREAKRQKKLPKSFARPSLPSLTKGELDPDS